MPRWQKTRCTVCGALLRPSGARKEDYPGTKAYGRSGLCMGHYEAERRGGGAAHAAGLQAKLGEVRPIMLHEAQAVRRLAPEDLWDILGIGDDYDGYRTGTAA